MILKSTTYKAKEEVGRDKREREEREENVLRGEVFEVWQD